MRIEKSRYGLVIFILSLSLFAVAQDTIDDELDLSELDEFGEEAKQSAPADGTNSTNDAAKDSASDEFDLENPEQGAEKENPDDLEKELEALDDGEEQPKEAKPAEPMDELPELDAPSEEVASPPAPIPESAPQVEPPPEPTPEQTPVAETPAPVVEPVQPPLDEPNSELESRLDRIYQKFMSEPTTDEEWLQIAGEKSTETYSVQAGDTLWGISVIFFGNGNFWPKIWQLNNDITNPHIIQPGRVIKFTPGTLSQSPTMQVTDAEAESGTAPAASGAEDESAADATDTQEEAENKSELAAIPPAAPRPPVVSPIPNSLPFIIGTSDDKYDTDGFAIEKQVVGDMNPEIVIQSVLKDPPPEVGKVVGIEMDRAETAAVYQNVFVQLPGARVGEVFTVYDLGPEVSYESQNYGQIVLYTGKVQIIEAVEGDLEDLYKAVVIKSFDHVRIGGRLIREEVPKLQLAEAGNLKSATGEVIGGPGRTDRKLFAEKSVAFLNVGTDQGVKPGDVLNIVRNELKRSPNTVVRRSTAVIGQVKLGQVAEKTSTGVVLNSIEAIQVGDLVATGLVVSKNQSQEAKPQNEEEDFEEEESVPQEKLQEESLQDESLQGDIEEIE